jgi:hypothetical protein
MKLFKEASCESAIDLEDLAVSLLVSLRWIKSYESGQGPML